MPVLNGIDAAREIQKSRPSTRFVLCSMYLDSQLASIARTVGITAVLSKSNVGQVVRGVEAELDGEPFAESKNLTRCGWHEDAAMHRSSSSVVAFSSFNRLPSL
jgi:DNA-binding NarL/FixJ family response regulator